MWSNEAMSLNNKKLQIDFFSSSSNKNRLLTPTKSNSKQLQTASDYLTPSMMNLCKLLDDELSRLLNDIEFSTNESKNQPNDSILSEDLRHFNEYLLANLQTFSQNLCDSLSNLINKLYEELKNSSKDKNDLYFYSHCNFAKIQLLHKNKSPLNIYCLRFQAIDSLANNRFSVSLVLILPVVSKVVSPVIKDTPLIVLEEINAELRVLLVSVATAVSVTTIPLAG
jgi:hypothetical protein